MMDEDLESEYGPVPPGWEPRPARDPVEVGAGLWRHWGEWSLLAFVAVLCAGLLPAGVLPVWLAAVIGVFGGTITTCFVYHFTQSFGLGLVFTGWSVLVTGWLTATRFTGVWHEMVLLGLAVPAVVLTLCGASVMARARVVEQVRAEDQQDRELARAEGGEARQMADMLATYGASGAKIFKVTQTASGRDYTGRLTQTGDRKPPSWSDLEGTRESLAIRLQLELEQVYFENPEGGSRADFVLHVQDRVSTAEVPMLPKVNTPTSITRPLDLGLAMATRKIFRQLFASIHVFIAGATGGGKSNLLDVMIAQHSRCVDNINFMIDLKGGMTARRWITPWVRKMCRRPVLDWVATDLVEAYLMLKSCNEGRKYRQKVTQGERVVISAKLPKFTIFVDETAAATGNNRRDELVEVGADGKEKRTLITSAMVASEAADLCEMGRATGYTMVICSVRGDASATGTTRIKAQCKLRFGLSVTQKSEAGAVFPDHQKAAGVLAGIKQLGAGLVLNLVKGEKISPPVWFYRVTDGTPDDLTGEATEDMITPIAADCGDNIVPAADDGTAEAMGYWYATRWNGRQHGEELKAACLGTAVLEHASTGDLEFDAVISEIPDPEAEVDFRHQRVRELLLERGVQGATPNWLFNKLLDEGQGASREVIQRWLKKDLTMDPPLLRKDATIPTKPRYIRIVRAPGSGEQKAS